MSKPLLKVLAVLLTATVLCVAACRFTDHIKPIDVDFTELAKKRLQFVYASKTDYSVNVDHAYMDLTKTGDNKYNSTTTIKKKDGTTDYKNVTTVYKGGVMLETWSGYSPSLYWVTYYILGKTSSGSGLLFYHCTDSELVVMDDLRYIVTPDGTALSDEDVNQLIEVDKKFNFTGGDLFRLPHKL